MQFLCSKTLTTASNQEVHPDYVQNTVNKIIAPDLIQVCGILYNHLAVVNSIIEIITYLLRTSKIQRKCKLTFSCKSLLSLDATSSFPLCSINCFSHGSNSARTFASSPRNISVSTICQPIGKCNRPLGNKYN